MPTSNLAHDIRTAISDHGRFERHIHDIKISTRRKTLGMTMQPGDPGITLHVPAGTRPADVVTVLARNADRIGGMLVKARKHAPDHPVKELVNGSGFVWLGFSARLRLVDNPTVPLEYVHDGQQWWQLDRAAIPQGAKPFIAWYIREGTTWLNQHHVAASQWNLMAGDRPMPTVRAADIGRRRWGSYNQETHTVRIAWQTLQLPHHLVRYVLAHELTHALQPGGPPHGSQFWRAFERSWPGAQQDARRLDEEGRSVWMGDMKQSVR
ncbi:hypothetical protein SUDANB145_07313 (plasmid) [Streptomyces sp. enrichment culture]|uniref:YgjP-like metallopeptidase domain-containing protein n=1 Tax=Streptomyces sp. enrichment culture TaxID=1795815 RepID=UPI003F5437E3